MPQPSQPIYSTEGVIFATALSALGQPQGRIITTKPIYTYMSLNSSGTGNLSLGVNAQEQH